VSGREWDEALARARRLVDQATADGLDEAIAELGGIEKQPAVMQDEPLVWRVRVALGSLYARRWLHGGWAAGDKTAGVRLLRAARLAGFLNAEDDFAAVLLLALMLLPGNAASIQLGTLASLNAAMMVGQMVMGGGQAIVDLREARELLVEARNARPDDPRTAKLAAFASALDAILGLFQLMTSGRGASIPEIQQLFKPLTDDPDNPAGSMLSAVLPMMQPLPPGETVATPGDESMPDEVALLFEANVPGMMTADELAATNDRLAESNPGAAALGRLAHAVRTNDPAELDAALGTLRTALQDPETAVVHGWLGNTAFPAMLVASSMMHGNRQDAAKAARRLQEDWTTPLLTEALLQGDPGAEGLRVGRLVLDQNLRTSEAWEKGDVQALESLVRELEQHELPDGAEVGVMYCVIPFQLALTELCLTVRSQKVEWLRRAVRHLKAALDASRFAPAAVRPLMESIWPAVLTLSAELEMQPVELSEAIARARSSLTSTPATYDQHVHTRRGIALALKAQYVALEGPERAAVLDQAIDELEQARSALTERSSPAVAFMVRWEQADAYRARGLGDDTGHAVTSALESLRLLSEDVLLQVGTEDGLSTAKAGAGRGLRAAGWALSGGRFDAALECLELGRAMVLSAAAAAGTVPERLRDIDEYELADDWERAPQTGLSEDSLTVPSDLRQRALRALHRVEVSSTPPTCSTISARLKECDVDALVYLLPETAESAGRAIVIRADGVTCDVQAPGLSGAAREPFDHYLDNSARRFAALRGPAELREFDTTTRWESALDGLCAWAGPTVLDPIIDALPTEPAPDRPARVVFVPCGLLGLVPWQAALLGRPATTDLARPLRACDLLVISYAASATELLRSLDREREPYGRDPVIVADPSSTLTYPAVEAVAIRDTYLHNARFLGVVGDDEPVEAPGTPEEVLALILGSGGAAPASMVQISAHGTAGTGPTTSRLRLAGSNDSLTVARILESATSGTRVAGLIVLDCCETDLSSRDHDESLTLTTAFVARGATDVIGSRWSIDDWATAVCVIAFHHYLAIRKLAPADALRAAQRWMLGPEDAREPMPVLREILQHEHRLLDAVSSWAPFIHQGNAGTGIS